MAVYPSAAIDVDKTSVQFKEKYVSAALNRKFAGMPLGIYRGFNPVVVGTDVLELQADPTFGDHVGMAEAPGGHVLAVREDVATITLDFTGQPLANFPILVVLEIDYDPPPSGSTSAIVKTIDPASFDFPRQVKICEVTRTSTLVANTTIPTKRQAPFAFSGTTAGFMPGTGFPNGGAIEELQAAAATTAEVQAARTSALATYPSLDARLDAELSGQGIADLVALVPAQAAGTLYLTGGAKPGWSGTGTSANVSADFSSTPGQPGTEVTASNWPTTPVTKGVVVAAPNNLATILDQNYDEIHDSSGNPIRGRLTYNAQALTNDGDSVAGGILFTVGSSSVVGFGTGFTTEVDEGDLIEAPDGTFLAVAAVIDDFNLQLVDLYAGATARSITLTRRRFTLAFYSFSGAVETPISLTAQSFRAVYHRLFDLKDRQLLSDTTATNRARAVGRIPDATTSVRGKVLLAPNLGVTSGTALQANDERIGATRVDTVTTNTGTLDSPTANKRALKFIQGPNVTITVTEQSDRIEVAITAVGGGATVTPYAGVPPADGGSGSSGTTADYARGDHQHPPSTAYLDRDGVEVLYTQVASATNLTESPTFRPRFALALFGRVLSAFDQHLSIGMCVGSNSNQQHSVIMGANFNPSYHGGYLAYGINGGNEVGWPVTAFAEGVSGFVANRTTVAGGGFGTLEGGYLIVGDNL